MARRDRSRTTRARSWSSTSPAALSPCDREPPDVSALALVKTMLIAAVVFTFLATVSTITYRITEAAVEVLILGRVVRRVPLGDIEEVHRRVGDPSAEAAPTAGTGPRSRRPILESTGSARGW